MKKKPSHRFSSQRTPYNLVPGVHPVHEALTGNHLKIREIWIADENKSTRLHELKSMAVKQRIPVYKKSQKELSKALPDVAHQGVAAVLEKFIYTDIEELANLHKQKKSLLIALDHITDEGNLGAIIRTAVFFAADGLILPKDRSADITAGVLKRSAGAFIHMPVAKVVNMVMTLDLLKKKGFWIIGAAGEGPDSIYHFDWDRHVVLVMGNEQKGLSPFVRKTCDQLIGIPVTGKAESLNVAVATGIMLSEIMRQRGLKTPRNDP